MSLRKGTTAITTIVKYDGGSSDPGVITEDLSAEFGDYETYLSSQEDIIDIMANALAHKVAGSGGGGAQNVTGVFVSGSLVGGFTDIGFWQEGSYKITAYYMGDGTNEMLTATQTVTLTEVQSSMGPICVGECVFSTAEGATIASMNITGLIGPITIYGPAMNGDLLQIEFLEYTDALGFIMIEKM